MLIWPEVSTWLIRLYGISRIPPDILIISIDDDNPQGTFTSLIDPVFETFSAHNPTLSLWLLHLCFQSFREINNNVFPFNEFIDSQIDTLLDTILNDTIKTQRKESFAENKNVLKNVGCKIWWIDMKDQHDNIDGAISILNSLIRMEANYGILTNNRNDLQQTINDYPGIRGCVKPLRNAEGGILERDRNGLYEDLILPFLTGFHQGLETISAKEWHNMRYSGIRHSRICNTCSPPHHWSYGDGTQDNHIYGVSNGFNEAVNVWNMLQYFKF